MAFNTTFSDLRKRRRIPMRLFEEQAAVNRSYIHGIEQGRLLPSPEKLEKIAAVFVAVAKEQESADPEADARRLFDERERTAVVDRLGFDPKLADAFVALRNLGARQRADLAEPLAEAVAFYATLEAKERQGLGPFVHEMVELFAQLDVGARQRVVVELAQAANEIRDRVIATEPGTALVPAEAQQGRDQIAGQRSRAS
jgi:transcriptional regulator with XRE-family HTH domain